MTSLVGPVTVSWIDIAPGFAGYLALPPGGSGPGLVLWQEIFGVNAHIRAVAEQYALAGYVVLAPDAFWRQAPGVELGYAGADRERAMALMQGHGAADALADAAAAVACLRARAEVTGRPVQFHYAERDDHIPPAAVDQVRAAIAAKAGAGKAAELHVYAGAMHGFNCWARASYHAGCATLALGRSLVFLAQALHR